MLSLIPPLSSQGSLTYSHRTVGFGTTQTDRQVDHGVGDGLGIGVSSGARTLGVCIPI